MNWGTLAFWIVALGVALVAVLNVAGGIRDLLTGLRKDLIDTQRARLGIEKDRLDTEKARLELEQKLPRELEKLSLELRALQEQVKRLESRIVHPSEDDVRLYGGLDYSDPGSAFKERQRGRKS